MRKKKTITKVEKFGKVSNFWPNYKNDTKENMVCMLYVIESPKRTQKNKETVYWAPNECGYVTFIGDAGIYTQEDITRITSKINKEEATPILITNDLLHRATEQCKKEDENITNDLLKAQQTYFDMLKEFEKDKQKNKERKENIKKLTEQINKNFM